METGGLRRSVLIRSIKRSGATRRIGVQEALEVVSVEDRRVDRAVAVGPGFPDGETVEERLEVVGVEHGWGVAAVVVGVARRVRLVAVKDAVLIPVDADAGLGAF